MTTSRRSGSVRADWLVPAGLILLTLVPMAAGGVRLAELAGGAEITAANERFFAVPLPVVLHIVGATVYCLFGALQFAPGLRRRFPRWHRVAGRILIPAGLVAALSGLWMTAFYPWAPGEGPLLAGFRLLFGTAMAVALVQGFVAVRRRDFRAHRAWMMRGYAIAVGAGTQALTLMPVILLGGTQGEFATAILMATGWVINLAVAEWLIRRRPRPSARVVRAAPTAEQQSPALP